MVYRELPGSLLKDAPMPSYDEEDKRRTPNPNEPARERAYQRLYDRVLRLDESMATMFRMLSMLEESNKYLNQRLRDLERRMGQ